MCLFALRRFEEAAQAYDQALRADPEHLLQGAANSARARGVSAQLRKRARARPASALEAERAAPPAASAPAGADPARAVGHGLAMRCELFRAAALEDFDVQTLVVPVAGGMVGARDIVLAPDPALARAGLRSLLAEQRWRSA